MASPMKSTVEKVSNLQRKINIEIPAAIVTTTFNNIFKEVQKQANLKGFRPGKAPLNIVKSYYADRVKQDVAQELIQKHYWEAVKEHKIEPINYPEFEFDVPSEDKDFSFSANIEVRPEINLKKYEGLDIEKEKFVMDEKRVDSVIENIRSSRAKQVTVLEDRAAQKGDTAIIDFEGSVDGKPLDGGTGTSHPLELGANQFIEGFEDGVVGMKVGQTKTLTLKFPDPYHAAELAGKPVDFKVTVKELKKKELPEMTDAFVAEMMGQPGSTEHTVESLKKTIREDIEQSEKKRIDTDFKNGILKKLVSLNPVDVPASMLKDQKQMLVGDAKKRFVEQGMPEAAFADYANKWDKDFESTAAEMIQSGFLVDAIADKHDLRAKSEDFENKYAEYAKQTGLDIQKIKEFYARPEQTSRLTYMVTEEKVLEFLIKSAKIKDVEGKANLQ